MTQFSQRTCFKRLIDKTGTGSYAHKGPPGLEEILFMAYEVAEKNDVAPLNLPLRDSGKNFTTSQKEMLKNRGTFLVDAFYKVPYETNEPLLKLHLEYTCWYEYLSQAKDEWES